jgi:hypothetical protein
MSYANPSVTRVSQGLQANAVETLEILKEEPIENLMNLREVAAGENAGEVVAAVDAIIAPKATASRRLSSRRSMPVQEPSVLLASSPIGVLSADDLVSVRRSARSNPNAPVLELSAGEKELLDRMGISHTGADRMSRRMTAPAAAAMARRASSPPRGSVLASPRRASSPTASPRRSMGAGSMTLREEEPIRSTRVSGNRGVTVRPLSNEEVRAKERTLSRKSKPIAAEEEEEAIEKEITIEVDEEESDGEPVIVTRKTVVTKRPLSTTAARRTDETSPRMLSESRASRGKRASLEERVEEAIREAEEEQVSPRSPTRKTLLDKVQYALFGGEEAPVRPKSPSRASRPFGVPVSRV